MSRAQHVILTNMCLIEDGKGNVVMRFVTQNVILGQAMLFLEDILKLMKDW